MRKLFFTSLALAAISVWAGGVVQSDYNQNATINISPGLKASNSTLGIPLRAATNSPVTRISVTIADLNDGGGDGTPDEQRIQGCRLWAYRYMGELRHADGGNGWSRWPQMDFDCGFPTNLTTSTNSSYTDGGTGLDNTVATDTAVTYSADVPAGNATRRLYYRSFAFTDGGGETATLPNHRIIIEGVYP